MTRKASRTWMSDNNNTPSLPENFLTVDFIRDALRKVKLLSQIHDYMDGNGDIVFRTSDWMKYCFKHSRWEK